MDRVLNVARRVCRRSVVRWSEAVSHTALVVCAALVVAATAGPALAQSAATGTVEGFVKDGTGAALPGVTVVVKNLDTGQTRDLTTDDAGRYRATTLPPGVYSVTATLSGFQSSTAGKVNVVVGGSVPVDLILQPAGVAETITVAADSPIVDTVRTDVSNVVGETAISNLPINGRRWENFVLLGPAVTNDGGFGLVSYRGISGLYNNNTVDGADNNQAFFSEARGRTRTSYSISQAAIKEFQVGISNFSAEFGRAAGGTVNAVTKSGTNRSRGEAFYFLREDSFTSADPFFPAGVDRPEERRQQFGVAFGGAITPNKLFYFVNYDQQLRDFPYFVRPSGANFFTGACTAVGCPSTIAFFESLSDFFPREGNNRILLGKVDYQMSNAHRLTAQYNLHRWDSPSGVQTQPTFSVAENANGKDVVKTDFFLLTLNSVLSQRMVNELRFQTGRDFEAQEPNGVGPSTTITNGIAFGMPDFLPRAKYPEEWRYQFVNNLSYYAGAHSIKTGIDINYVREDIINLFNGGGVYAYGNSERHGAGLSDWRVRLHADGYGASRRPAALQHRSCRRSTCVAPGSTATCSSRPPITTSSCRTRGSWARQFTANFGLRYEYQQLPQPGQASVKGAVFAGNPLYPQTTSFNKDKNNWGPRVGITYDLGGRAPDRRARRVGHLLRPHQQQRHLELADEQRRDVRDVRFAADADRRRGAPQYPNTYSAPPSWRGHRAADSVSRARSASGPDRDGRGHPRASAWLGDHVLGLLPVQQGQPPADVRRREPAAADADRRADRRRDRAVAAFRSSAGRVRTAA